MSHGVDARGNPVPLVFDEQLWLQRLDVQALPPNYQNTLLYLNANYQRLLDIQAAQIGVLDAALADAEAELADFDALLVELKKAVPGV